MPPVIRFFSSFRCWPTWNHADGDNLDPASLGLPPDLLARLLAWDDRFQAIFNDDYPPDSAFPTPEAEAEWTREGDAIVAALKALGLSIIDQR